MADVTGPIWSLAGSHHRVPDDSTCDYCDRKATIRVQGETDSFGSELIDYCQECWNKQLAYRKSPEGEAARAEERKGCCEWCGSSATDLRDARDYDEGMTGCVYRVCGACVKRRDDKVAAELEDDYY